MRSTGGLILSMSERNTSHHQAAGSNIAADVNVNVNMLLLSRCIVQHGHHFKQLLENLSVFLNYDTLYAK